MPIEKHRVIHRFGIFTEARRDELVQKVIADDSYITSNHKSPKFYTQGIKEKVSQLNTATTDEQFLSFENEAWTLLQKVKFKITTIDGKNGLSDLKGCWVDLTLFLSCKSRKLQHEALVILQRSLCDSPLSKSLMSTLVDIMLSSIQTFCSEITPYPWDTRYIWISEVIFIVSSKLYYHYLVNDLKELRTDGLRQLILLSKALHATARSFQDNPILKNALQIIGEIIVVVCPVEVRHPSVTGSSENESASEEISITPQSSPSLTSDKSERSPLARFLWYSLKLWKCVSRQIEVGNEIIDKLCLTDFFGIDSGHDRWLDYILAFYILCECSKLKLECVNIFLSFRTKMLPKKVEDMQTAADDKYQITWSLDLVTTYLKCLADVCVFATSISSQRLALLGDENLYGLIDYVVYIPDLEHSSKIKICVYQLLCDVYSFYQTDPMKDGLKNITWQGIMKFKSSAQSNSLCSSIQNYQVRTFDSQQSIGAVFSKIATNLCVIAFTSKVAAGRDVAESSKRRPTNSKCFKKDIKVDNKDQVKSRGQTSPSQIKPREQECWMEVQRIAADHFEKELAEDEVEKEILRMEATSQDGIQRDAIS